MKQGGREEGRVRGRNDEEREGGMKKRGREG